MQKDKSSLRVALVVESSSAGVGRHVIDLANALADLRHSVTVIYSARRMDERFERGLEQLASRAVKVSLLDMRHGPHPSDLWTVMKARRYLLDNGPFDIVHCHSTKAGLIGRIAAASCGYHSVYTPHALLTMSPNQGRLYRALVASMERSLAAFCRAVICVSSHEKRHAIELGLDPDKLRVIHNGINLAETSEAAGKRAAMRNAFGLSANEICIGFVGRMFPQKSPLGLLEAFALIQNRPVPACRLVFVGSGPEQDALRDRAKQLSCSNRVVLAGEMNGLEAMSSFDIYAMPSLYEGLPYVLLEALSMGLPIIATDVGGVSELVHHGTNGIVVRPGEIGEMADALERILEDESIRLRMGVSSHELVQSFTLSAMACRIEDLYYSLRSRSLDCFK